MKLTEIVWKLLRIKYIQIICQNVLETFRKLFGNFSETRKRFQNVSFSFRFQKVSEKFRSHFVEIDGNETFSFRFVIRTCANFVSTFQNNVGPFRSLFLETFRKRNSETISFRSFVSVNGNAETI